MSKIKIVTWNIRYATDGDGINNFIHRSGMIRQKIKAELPELIAFQEVTDASHAPLEEMLPEYYFLGIMRSKSFDNEGLYIAARKDAFEVIGLETVWLSETPYEAGSRFENQSICPRVCTMLYVRHRESNFRMRIFDLHLDHISEEARMLGMRATLDFVESYDAKEKLPTVILGDYNAGPDCSTIKYCNEYEKTPLFDVTKDIPLTYHGFGGLLIPEWEKIDYIYVTGELEKRHISTEIWDTCKNGIYLSDHYPVCAEFEI